jgi:hypothetical protein
VGAAAGDVSLKVVVAVDEPVDGGRGVGGEAHEVLARVGAEVARDDVLSLQPVLDKVDVPARLEGHVVLHAQVVDAVDGDGAVERVVDRVLAHVRVLDGADHVEVDRVAADAPHLPRVAHLDVLDARGERLALRAVEDRLVRLGA